MASVRVPFFGHFLSFVLTQFKRFLQTSLQLRPPSHQEVLAAAGPGVDQPVRSEPHRDPADLEPATLDSHLPEELEPHDRLVLPEL